MGMGNLVPCLEMLAAFGEVAGTVLESLPCGDYEGKLVG